MDLAEVLRSYNRPRKIAVCTAWGSPFVWTHGAYNMMNLDRPEGVAVKYMPGFGRNPGIRHMWGVTTALKWGATHICFLGADQIHDVDILVKFTEHISNGWPMVTALVPIRGWVKSPGVEKPFQKVAWKWRKEVINNGIVNPTFDAMSLEMINPADGPYQEAVVVGSGALMFDVALLHQLKKPWFIEAEPDEDGNRRASMDTHFCWRLVTEAGGRMLCDCTIKVQHLDVFPIDDSFGDRFADWKYEDAKKALYWDM